MRAPRRSHRWPLALLALTALGSPPLAGCDALQTGAPKETLVAAKPGLRLRVLGDFSHLAETGSRFGRLEVSGGGKLSGRVLKRADLAAALQGTKTLAGVTVTASEVTLDFSDLEPGDYALSVTLYDQVTGGTKLSDNAFQRKLEAGILEIVRLDMTQAIASTVPTPAPTAAPTQGSLAARVDLIGTGDGQAHPETLTGTLAEHFGLPTASGSQWVYTATQSVYLNATDHFTSRATRSVDILNGGSVRLNQESMGATLTLGTYGSLDLAGGLRHFGSLGIDSFQRTGATRSFAVGGATYVGAHYVLTAARFADEDPVPRWPVPVSTHTYDLWYAMGVGLLESRDTVHLTDGRVKPGLHLRLRAFRRGT